MASKKGFYSLVQFCPDHSRMEAANIGVMLCVPDAQYVQVRLATGNQRVQKFFGRKSVDLDWLKTVKQSLEKRLITSKASLSGLEEFDQFIATRANQLILTPPRPTKVLEPEEDLSKLFEELVGGRAVPKKKMEPALPDLDAAFRQPSLVERIKFNEKIPVPIVGRTLEVPYAYQNGKLNLVKPLPLSKKGRIVPGTESLAIEGDLIQKRSPCSLIVLPHLAQQGPASLDNTRNAVTELFREYSIRTVWSDERTAFIKEVEQEAH